MPPRVRSKAAHVYLAACLFCFFWSLLWSIEKPSQVPALLVWISALSWVASSAYLTWSILGWFERFTEGRDEIDRLHAEAERLRQLVESRNDDCNEEHGVRRKLEGAIFQAIQKLHAANRFKSQEAQEIRELLEASMLETLDPKSGLRAEILKMKEGA